MSSPQAPRFGDLLQRLLLTKGFSEGNVLEDYFPTIDLLSQSPELFRLRSERTFQGAGKGVGAIGLGGRVWIMNKKAGQLTIVDGLMINAKGAPGTVHVNMTTIGLPADGAGGQTNIEGSDSRDGRGIPGTTPVVGTTMANDAVGAPAVGALQVITLSITPVRFVLKPGYALTVASDSTGAGNDLLVSFRGWERSVEDSELK